MQPQPQSEVRVEPGKGGNSSLYVSQIREPKSRRKSSTLPTASPSSEASQQASVRPSSSEIRRSQWFTSPTRESFCKLNKASREASHLFLHHTFSFKMVAFPKKKDWRISAERRLWFQSPTYTRARAHIRLYSCHFISILSLTDDSKLQLNVKHKCKI